MQYRLLVQLSREKVQTHTTQSQHMMYLLSLMDRDYPLTADWRPEESWQRERTIFHTLHGSCNSCSFPCASHLSLVTEITVHFCINATTSDKEVS